VLPADGSPCEIFIQAEGHAQCIEAADLVSVISQSPTLSDALLRFLQHFETKGLITTARGSITILDRDGLEEGANGLYDVPEAEYERLFPQ